MGANFRITSRRKGDDLHLHLTGNFDGSSAMELIYALRENEWAAEKIYIETDGISELQPFGQDVFQKNLSIAPARAKKLIFIGGSSQDIAPRGSGCLLSAENPPFDGAVSSM